MSLHLLLLKSSMVKGWRLQAVYVSTTERKRSDIFFKKWAIPGLFFRNCRFSTQLTVMKCSKKDCQWLDSNHGSLMSEATALPLSHNHIPIEPLFTWGQDDVPTLFRQLFELNEVLQTSLAGLVVHEGGAALNRLVRVVVWKSYVGLWARGVLY